jgi:hypothetical protein
MHLVLGMEGGIELVHVAGDGLDDGAVGVCWTADDRLGDCAVERHTCGILWAAEV